MKRGGFLRSIRDFIYGFFLHGMASEVHERKGALEDVFTLLFLGETIGVPVFPGFYSLRLVPYCAARFPRWKEKILKPKDLLDIVHD
jgi:hypothetical protein